MNTAEPLIEPRGPKRRRIERWLFAGLFVTATAVWGFLLTDNDSALMGFKKSKSEIEQQSSVEALIPSTVIGTRATTLALRKKLDLPVELNVIEGPLTSMLDWFEDQLGLTFVYQADLSSLQRVSKSAVDVPLREVLGDIFSRRNLGFILQRGNIVVIPCEQNVKSTVHGGVRSVSFQMGAEIFCRVNESVEMYCGERAQYRLYLLAQPLSGPAEQTIYEIRYSIYEDSDLLASGELEAANEQEAHVEIESENDLFLEVRPFTDDGIDLALSVKFRYTEKQQPAASNPVAP